MERAEKQMILAKHMRELISLLDDTPVVPGDERPLFEHESKAHSVLQNAESDLKSWQPSHKPINMESHSMATNAMPVSTASEGDTMSTTTVPASERDNMSSTGTVGAAGESEGLPHRSGTAAGPQVHETA